MLSLSLSPSSRVYRVRLILHAHVLPQMAKGVTSNIARLRTTEPTKNTGRANTIIAIDGLVPQKNMVQISFSWVVVITALRCQETIPSLTIEKSHSSHLITQRGSI